MAEPERNEIISLQSSLQFLLPEALQMTHPMDLFNLQLSEMLVGQNYEPYGGCTRNSSLCLPWCLLRSTFTASFLRTNWLQSLQRMRYSSFGNSFIRSRSDGNIERPQTENPCCLRSESILCSSSCAYKNSTGQFLSLKWVLSIQFLGNRPPQYYSTVEERSFWFQIP